MKISRQRRTATFAGRAKKIQESQNLGYQVVFGSLKFAVLASRRKNFFFIRTSRFCHAQRRRYFRFCEKSQRFAPMPADFGYLNAPPFTVRGDLQVQKFVARLWGAMYRRNVSGFPCGDQLK